MTDIQMERLADRVAAVINATRAIIVMLLIAPALLTLVAVPVWAIGAVIHFNIVAALQRTLMENLIFVGYTLFVVLECVVVLFVFNAVAGSRTHLRY